jgi:hypothetical protein
VAAGPGRARVRGLGKEKLSLTFEEAYERIPGDGWLTEPEARLLWGAASVTEGPILEVGCYKGRSTCLLAYLGRPVYVVEPFSGFSSDDLTGEKIKATFLSNLDERGIHACRVFGCKMPGPDARVWLFEGKIEEWTPRPVGFAYLDGDHTYAGTVAQIQKAMKGEPAVVAIHDVNDTGEGRDVKLAATTLLGPWDERVERLAVWRF